MDLTLGTFKLLGLAERNIILGKNGCGKSHLLRHIDAQRDGLPNVGHVRYVNPERAGQLAYDSGIEQNIANDPTWINSTRRQNQSANFRQQSVAQFAHLERVVLRSIEKVPALRQDASYTFDTVVLQMNQLLDRVRISRSEHTFKIRRSSDDAPLDHQQLSSGEAELISLAIECLVFAHSCKAGKFNLLLVDEPDVHLHPDLQHRFAQFALRVLEGRDATLLLATHSTALVAGMHSKSPVQLALMRAGDQTLNFRDVTDTHRRVLPIFGAHPLSNVFNESRPLLVEGDDDVRVWQQAVRSSQGRIRVYPCPVDGLAQMADFERTVDQVIGAVYDNAVALSVRDRDAQPEEIADIGHVRRMRLACRAAENLLLADESLALAGTSWAQLRPGIEAWIAAQAHHRHHASMVVFRDGGYDRMGADLKEIRNDLLGIMGESKPWEVLAGQAIGALAAEGPGTPTSLRAFLGARVCAELGL